MLSYVHIEKNMERGGVDRKLGDEDTGGDFRTQFRLFANLGLD